MAGGAGRAFLGRSIAGKGSDERTDSSQRESQREMLEGTADSLAWTRESTAVWEVSRRSLTCRLQWEKEVQRL